jgi:hypothetical protein
MVSATLRRMAPCCPPLLLSAHATASGRYEAGPRPSGGAYPRPPSSALIRVPVSPDISQIIAPKRLLALM